MGRLAAPFGVKGWLRVHTFSEMVDALTDYTAWHIAYEGNWKVYPVQEWQLHSTGLVVHLAGVNDRDAAFALRGHDVAVPRDSLPTAPENQYYWSDLLGMQVVNQQHEVLGEISQILEAGAHDVLVVQGERERLIPFVAQIVGHVDTQARQVTVDWQLDY